MSATAYFGDETLKAKYVARMKGHREADELVQGYYWIDGKGCCVGCAAHVNENPHEALEEQTAIPVTLSKLADVIFEGLPTENAMAWPERFFAAPRPGADLSKVHRRFYAWLLTDFFASSLKPETWAEVKPICTMVATLHRRTAAGEVVTPEEWAAASAAASDAASDAASAAASDAASDAARAAAWAAASDAASAAASAAAWAAASDAAWAAASDAASAAASAAAWAAAWKTMADKLVEPMAAA